MPVHKDIDALPQFVKSVITIGSFDGVHEGHKKILKQVVSEAHQIEGTPILVTFYPHPSKVIQGRNEPLAILTSQQEKYERIFAAGITDIVEVPFNKEFAQLSATEYIRNFLISKFHPSIIITGYDHKFGNNREGDFNLLKKFSKEENYIVEEIPAHVLASVTVSSTKIRNALLAGDIVTAETYLGYPYQFTGTVVKGNQLGRTIGFPTANILPSDPDNLIPANGVYAVQVLINDNLYHGIMNIGVRPTIGGINRVIEVNIFNFEQDIYGEKLTIIFKHHLRGEKKFENLDALKQQIASDKNKAIELFSNGLNS